MSDAEKNNSDTSDDEDYKPENDEEISDAVQDESGSSDESDGGRDCVKQPRRKRRKKASDGDKGEQDNEKFPNAEEEKKHADALWADFLSDVDPPPPKAETSRGTVVAEKGTKVSKVDESSSKEAPKEVPKVKIFDFAGEEVKVSIDSAPKTAKHPAQGAVARPSRSSGGLSSVLGSLGKKPKISTLEKSKLDWNSFKTSEGIGEDLERFNKGKDGFLERQDFLERTDYRQFDLEREMRQNKRSSR